MYIYRERDCRSISINYLAHDVLIWVYWIFMSKFDGRISLEMILNYFPGVQICSTVPLARKENMRKLRIDRSMWSTKSVDSSLLVPFSNAHFLLDRRLSPGSSHWLHSEDWLVGPQQLPGDGGNGDAARRAELSFAWPGENGVGMEESYPNPTAGRDKLSLFTRNIKKHYIPRNCAV